MQSADRDEDVFSQADKFDIHRKQDTEDNMGFGHGTHRCQGEWLSRAELEIVFGTYGFLHRSSYKTVSE